MSDVVLERPSERSPFDFLPNSGRDTFGIRHERSYPIRRNGKQYDVHDTATGLKVRRRVGGGATAPTPPGQQDAASAALNAFLAVAPVKKYVIKGAIPAGTSGGGVNVVWTEPIPIIPAFCIAVEYEITLPVTMTYGVAPTFLSPFAPYCAFSEQMTIGGAPPWPYTEMTAWKLDDGQHRTEWDPMNTGLGGNSPNSNTQPAFANSLDYGVTALQQAMPLTPGLSYSATQTGKVFQFKIRQQFQRKRHLLWGAIPFGDPENRPNNLMQLNTLIGNNPEANLFQNTSTSTSTAVTSGPIAVSAIYYLMYIDLLPPSLAQAPAPAVGYGLQVTPTTYQGLTAGNIAKMTHRTAQVYTTMHHILVNGQADGHYAPIQADYFGLWDDQDQQSAKWVYDAMVGSFNNYFTDWQRNYRRYPYIGSYTAELDDGLFPEVPSVTPFRALMSPDASYAQTFDIPVTPAMTTAIRIPSTATAVNPYVRGVEFGLVRVPY